MRFHLRVLSLVVGAFSTSAVGNGKLQTDIAITATRHGIDLHQAEDNFMSMAHRAACDGFVMKPADYDYLDFQHSSLE